MKNIKMLAVASMISLGALSMVACQKTEPDIKIEKDIQGTGIGEYKGDVEVTPQAPTQIQNTGDPIKDEASWPIGKFGYHEPPEELRQESINPITKKAYTNRYTISLHDDKYGDLTLSYNTQTGQRTLFKGNDGSDATKRLAIFNNTKPIAELLEDLTIGDAIADAWGK